MIENMIRREFVRYLVQKAIFCPITQEVLDFRTCVVVNDSDGDPAMVVSPTAGKRMKELMDEGVPVLSEGYSLDESTL